MKKKILEKIKITPKILKEDFDITIFEDIKYSLRPFADHKEVAKELANKGPFLITVIIETLKPEYWRRKKYAKQTKVAILSKYVELLYQYFFEEYDREQGDKIYAGWLEKYRSRWKKEGEKKEIDDYIIENELGARYKNKILKRYKRFPSLCLPAYDIGSNYFLSSDEEDKVLKGTNFLRWEALFKVDEITIEGGAWIENTK